MKKLFYFIFLLTIIFTITGCSFSEINKEQKNNYEKVARENAIRYLEKKYGINVEIIKTEAEINFINDVNFGKRETLTGSVYVTCKYNSKQFEVYISGKEETLDGFDNYEYDKINKDVTELISRKVGGGYKRITLYYGLKNNLGYNGLISGVYDSSNIELFINANKINILSEYINSNIKLNKEFSNLTNSKILIVNYSDNESYNKSNFYNSFNLSDDEDFLVKINFIGVKEAYYYNFGHEKYYSFNVWKNSNIYYYVDDLNVNNSISINLYNSIGNNELPITYQITDFKNIRNFNIYVFFMSDSIKNYNLNNNYKVVLKCDDKTYTEPVYKFNNYLAIELNLNNCYNSNKILFSLEQ